ncbi:MAG: FMN-binding glutamate synthase family protein [Crenarchaeota archaeon 13_1_20CM_2_53_14]|nr:MAG: FMN-binding glutamate synthase family protein [archaeon 13_2_20CM_2_53_6]OLE58691.1 MAG: FMN-binding glutamate synthase family protein [Crenarchaeota archaeon 13_1_20CM_2_53_14]TMI27450.1 MAG: FMN-binding glutamate synthase family protein [Candidatus Bathyarchaeota archaeon]
MGNLELIVEKHTERIHRGLEVLPTLKHGVPDGLGNKRWTGDLILATYEQALTGDIPQNDLEYKTGNSGGGFDVLGWKSHDRVAKVDQDQVDLSIPLNKRGDGEKIEIPVPIYGGGMSFGSISLNFMIARARAARRLGTYTSTGEGGYPDQIVPYRNHVITQVATGMFGVREETIQYAPIVEFKYAQGAKPGLGGHLLADKVTSEVAKMRESSMFTSLYSPFPFHSVYSVEDHKKHVDWIKTVNPRALVSVKVSTPTDVDMVAIGSYYAGANIIHIDGGYGGTGAAPEIAKKNIAMPIEYAIPKVHDYLVSEGVRDEITLMASGGIRTADDIAKAIALGADGCVVATAEAVAVGCTHCGNCERGRGCQVGITTTDPELSQFIDPEWGEMRIVNLFNAWSKRLRILLASFGLESIRELRGRKDLLVRYK